MADITMCTNQKCRVRDDCFRFMAQPKEYSQSWAEFKPESDGECKHFWSMEV